MTASPRPEFQATLREQLTRPLPEQERPEPRTTGPRHSRRRSRGSLFPRLLSTVLVASMVLSGVWTYRSMPGDTFYPLKRAAESTLFHLSTDEAERANRSLGYAETRAREVQELLGSGERKDMIGETLQAMEDTTRSAVTSLEQVRRRDAHGAVAVELEEFEELKHFVRKQRTQITGMLPKMDAEDQRRAHGYLDYIDGLAPPG
ncbi:DUF5667 domain-containing protein [Streptosporangium sp. NPDC023615]|uniref:DUF5667 domain-containing protein n=1 Tax=Streptosporangium sp. NPDC023615 TaxID=3154794 RepID=UPI0034199E01